MTKVTPKSDLQGKKANVKGLRSVSKAYKSNVEPMEQQKVKKLTKAQRYHSKPAEEGEVPKGGGKESGSVRKGRPLWGFFRVPQPPPSTRCLRYTRRECIKAQLQFLRDRENCDLA